MKESLIQHAIRVAVNKDGRARVVRNNTGECPSTHVVYGLGTGGADLVGLLRGTGRVFCLEVKQPGKKPRPEQEIWLDSVRRLGGFAAPVTSVPEALAALDRACAGATQ